MTNCRDITKQASDYLDRHLTLRQRLAFALHLLICGKCRLFLRHLRLALTVYQHMPQQEISTQEAEAVVSKALGDKLP